MYKRILFALANLVAVPALLAQSPPGTASSRLAEILTAEKHPALEVDLSLQTDLGYLYEIVGSDSLEGGAWTAVSSAYGFGQQVVLRVHEGVVGGGSPPPTADPIAGFTFHLMGLDNGTTFVQWIEGGNTFGIIHPQPLPTNFPPTWAQRVDAAPTGDPDGDYHISAISLMVLFAEGQSPPEALPPGGANDATLKKLTDVWSLLATTVRPRRRLFRRERLGRQRRPHPVPGGGDDARFGRRRAR